MAYLRKFRVRSNSNPEKKYTVSQRTDGIWECSCPAWKYRRQTCSHIMTAQQYTEDNYYIEEMDVLATGKIVDIAEALAR